MNESGGFAQSECKGGNRGVYFNSDILPSSLFPTREMTLNRTKTTLLPIWNDATYYLEPRSTTTQMLLTIRQYLVPTVPSIDV